MCKMSLWQMRCDSGCAGQASHNVIQKSESVGALKNLKNLANKLVLNRA